MPIIIYKTNPKLTTLAELCEDNWSLPEQVAALERWISKKRKKEAGGCIADIGFQWRKEAGGGGSALPPEMLKKLGEFDVTLFLSEYPGFVEESD